MSNNPTTSHPTEADFAITLLSSETLLEVSGRDAVSFLHNQASCDLKQRGNGAACFGSFCNPQGRVLADFTALTLNDEKVLLRLRRDLAEATLANLARFAMFSKVALRDVGDEWHLLAIQGAGCSDVLQPSLGELPNRPLAWAGRKTALALQLGQDSEALELWVHAADESALLTTLMAQQSPQENEDHWRAATLRQGVARLEAATSAEFLPQQLNFDLTGHINFRKGCYPGQEVIARMHYKGKAKRRLLLMALPKGMVLQSGAPVYQAERAQAAGVVINVATDSTGETIALVTTTEAAADEGLYGSVAGGTALRVLPLPYAVTFG